MSKWKKYRPPEKIALRENILKKLFLHQYENIPLPSWTEAERKELETLKRDGSVWGDGNRYFLTEKGQRQGAAIVRKHRIYETYLAKKTGIDPSRWHELAEKEEHLIDAGTLARWEKELGFPLVDPHGDVIPDEKGEIAPPVWETLQNRRSHWATVYKVVHVEDEPASVYRKLLQKGFYPGMIMRVHFDGNNWQVEYEGLKTVLTPAEAALLSVIPLDADVWDAGIWRLSLLEPGERGIIVRLSDRLQGLLRQRLLDLGFVPGTAVSVYLRAPWGDPTAYDVKGATIALRKEQAAMILVKISADEHP